ncbi:hypothetical protein [Pseudomonas sp. PDM27]|uniref:hypothetical protein n=1 Tax=Pseudomonas sp. PDM27 TaxID=2854769 RepID=UPI0011AFA978|nr:hypothetical protein [Pseudomonas sp. PDM27]MBV7569788.1 hypothetical protein [Pseudomonas sp. PDM27]
MKVATLTTLLSILLSPIIYAAEDTKPLSESSEFKNESPSRAITARIYNHPDTTLQPGQSMSIPFFPTAGGIFNAAPHTEFQFFSISRSGCSKNLCFLFSDSKIESTTSDHYSTQQNLTIPDFEVLNDGSAEITVQKTGDPIKTIIGPGGRFKITGIHGSGFSIKGFMKTILIERQKCDAAYCYRVRH